MCCFVLLLNASGISMSCFGDSMSCFGDSMSCFCQRTCIYRFFNSLFSPNRRFFRNSSRYSEHHKQNISNSMCLLRLLLRIFDPAIVFSIYIDLTMLLCIPYPLKERCDFNMLRIGEHVHTTSLHWSISIFLEYLDITNKRSWLATDIYKVFNSVG